MSGPRFCCIVGKATNMPTVQVRRLSKIAANLRLELVAPTDIMPTVIAIIRIASKQNFFLFSIKQITVKQKPSPLRVSISGGPAGRI